MPQPEPRSNQRPRPRDRTATRGHRADPSRFRGFARDAMQFWHELAAEMSREWYLANKARYEAVWRDPMLALLGEVARRLTPVYRPLAIDPPGVLRLHRDLRFSHDRTPYKTHIAGVLRPTGAPIAKVGNAALYFELGLEPAPASEGRAGLGGLVDDEYAGNGCYQFVDDKLARWRRAVAGAPGARLAPLIHRLGAAGYRIRGDEYQRVPSGFAPDHPRAALLKKRGLTCAFPAIPAGLLHEPALADWLVQHTTTSAPLVIWLHRHVG
jgi:uncharacterized protein (TIGR02453 family)